jgi:hypothetical protein
MRRARLLKLTSNDLDVVATAFISAIATCGSGRPNILAESSRAFILHALGVPTGYRECAAVARYSVLYLASGNLATAIR